MKVTAAWMPDGDAGTRQTLRLMTEQAIRGSHTPLVRAWALTAIHGTGARDLHGQARALRGWLQQHFHFVRDPVDAELVHAPEVLLAQLQHRGAIYGDCDDAAVLGAALARSIGFATRWQVVGFQAGQPMGHVYAEIGPVGGLDAKVPWWVDLDVTRPAQALPAVKREWVIPF